jgi:hypothetical protein
MLRDSSSLSEQKAAFMDKQVLLIASAGGSGNSILSCLEQMDRFCGYTGALIFDYLSSHH